MDTILESRYAEQKPQGCSPKKSRLGLPQGLPSSCMLSVLYLNECPREFNKLRDHSYPFVDDNTHLLIQTGYENQKMVIARVAGINHKIMSIYSLYDDKPSEPKSFMLSICFRPKQHCLAGIKLVNFHRILGIVVGMNGKLHGNHGDT